MRTLLGIIPQEQNPSRTHRESVLHQATTTKNGETKPLVANKLSDFAASFNIDKNLIASQKFAIGLWKFLNDSQDFALTVSSKIIPAWGIWLRRNQGKELNHKISKKIANKEFYKISTRANIRKKSHKNHPLILII